MPAFTGLGAPYWDADARGAILGLNRGSTAAHVARASLEGIAHQVTDLLEAMRADGVATDELRVDGGACANDLLMQMQADFAGIPILRPAAIEATAQGAAFLAGLGVGLWASPGDLPAPAGEVTVFEPKLGVDEREAWRADWRAAVARIRTD